MRDVKIVCCYDVTKTCIDLFENVILVNYQHIINSVFEFPF